MPADFASILGGRSAPPAVVITKEEGSDAISQYISQYITGGFQKNRETNKCMKAAAARAAILVLKSSSLVTTYCVSTSRVKLGTT